MAAEGLHHYCRHLGLSPRDPSGPRTVDLGACNNDGGRPPSIILYFSYCMHHLEASCGS